MKSIRRILRGQLLILAVLLAGLAIGACGGSSGAKSTSSKNTASTSTTAHGTSAAMAAFRACLKQHGVTLPSRPGGFRFRGGTSTNGAPPTGTTPGGGYPGGGYPGGGGGFFGGGGRGFAGGNSKFAKAFAACGSKLPAGGFGRRFPGGAGGGHFTPRLSTSVLRSYVACIRKNGYPAMPEPKASSSGSVFPAGVRSNAKFLAANRKCQSILVKALRPAAGGHTLTVPGGSQTSTTSTA